MAEGEFMDDNPKIDGYSSRIKSMAYKGRGGSLTTPRSYSSANPASVGPMRWGGQKFNRKRRGK